MYEARLAISGQISAVIFSSHFFIRSLRLLCSCARVARELVCVQKPRRLLLIVAMRRARERRKFDVDPPGAAWIGLQEAEGSSSSPPPLPPPPATGRDAPGKDIIPLTPPLPPQGRNG